MQKWEPRPGVGPAGALELPGRDLGGRTTPAKARNQRRSRGGGSDYAIIHKPLCVIPDTLLKGL
jgi:hypothetical protein